MAKSAQPRKGKAKNNRPQGKPRVPKSNLMTHVVGARSQCENAMAKAGNLSLKLLDTHLVSHGNTQEISSMSVVFAKDLIEHRSRLEAIHSLMTRPFRDTSENDAIKASSIVQQYLEWIESFEAVIEPSILRLGMLLLEAEENLTAKSTLEPIV